MALQKSGQISLSNIASEKGVSLSNLSLQAESTLRINRMSLQNQMSLHHTVLVSFMDITTFSNRLRC